MPFTSKTLSILPALAVLSLGGLAVARDASLTPEQFVAARQASYDMSAWNIGGIREAMKSGREAKTQFYGSFGISRWAHVLPTLFPAGTGEGETKVKSQALPEIWRDRPAFEAAAANYAAAADKLVDLAKANDTEGFKAQLLVVSQACDACHARFKDGDKGPK